DVDMLNASVEGLVEELMECSDSDLDGRVRLLELERRRIEAELALTAGEIDRRQSYLDDGHRSLKAYLRATCSYSDAEAARVGRLTAAAADVPGLADALHDGRIGTPQANELAAAFTNQRVRYRLGDFAPMLLELAERLSFREFRLDPSALQLQQADAAVEVGVAALHELLHEPLDRRVQHVDIMRMGVSHSCRGPPSRAEDRVRRHRGPTGSRSETFRRAGSAMGGAGACGRCADGGRDRRRAGGSGDGGAASPGQRQGDRARS
ncbi:MAG: DUF222 domain-containing protein, partial [Acidimicrobiales bacterium]